MSVVAVFAPQAATTPQLGAKSRHKAWPPGNVSTQSATLDVCLTQISQLNMATSSSQMVADLCPLEDRRTSTELWIKLVVVHFTTITAFCHLLSIRGESILSWRLVYYFLVPLLLIAQHFLAPLLCLLITGSWLLKPEAHPVRALYRAASWMFGRMPPEGDYLGYEMLPVADSGGRSSHTQFGQVEAGSRTQIDAKKAGRIIVAAAFLLQCIGTIYIYRRRVSHGAATKTDRRIFELACSGLVTSILTILTLAKVPVFIKTIPEMKEKDMLVIDHTMLHLRDTILKQYTDATNTLSFLKNGAFAFVLLICLNEYKLVRALKAICTSDFWILRPERGSYEEILWELLHLGWSCFLSCVGAMFAIYIMSRSKSRQLRSNRRCKGYRAWYIWPLFPFVVALLCVPTAIYIGCLPTFTISIFRLCVIYDEITVLGQWPTNQTCPQLWTDPQANWIWMLA